MMVAGFLAPIIARTGITALGSFAKTPINKTPLGNIVSGITFGAGYSSGTYIGFPKNYSSNFRPAKATQLTLKENMAYGRNQKWFSFRKTRWYWKPTYHRKMRRTVYTHPRRSRY